MPITAHVNGPAIVYVTKIVVPVPGASQPFGFNPPWTPLGWTEDGVDITINYYDKPLITDAGGPNVPSDVQDMGKDAEISGRFNMYDLAILQQLRASAGGTEGTLGPAGRFMLFNGHAFGLGIYSTTDEPWRFYCAKLRSAQRAKIGTIASVQQLSFYAWAPIGYLPSSANVPLFDHLPIT